MVGVAGFEPTTTCTRNRCAPKLRYTPTRWKNRKNHLHMFDVPCIRFVVAGCYNHIDSFMAEEAGFEPAQPSSNSNGLANRPLQPLEYSSRSQRLWVDHPESNRDYRNHNPASSPLDDGPHIFFGVPRRIRTCDLPLRRRMLSSAELVGHMVRPERFELPTPWFVARCSDPLSYGRETEVISDTKE